MGNLSINPIDDITARTGQAAIVILLLTLAVTPVQIVTGYNPVAKIRKSLGLWAFAYALVHLWVFVGLDYGYSWRFIVQDGLVQKPYIIVGLLALLILLPLAITSTRGWMKRMGKQWKRLHQLIYAAGVLAVLHYIWVGKVFFGKPVYFAVLLAVLLAVRVPPVRRAVVQARQRWWGKRQSVSTQKAPTDKVHAAKARAAKARAKKSTVSVPEMPR
ncbi:MAG: protein-methionine-sulfoxide reductase heme-binding subunit MsrQ [Litorilinea sp.]